MPSFSKRSLGNLAQCHPDLQKIAHECIKTYDFVVVCGHRGKLDQEKAFDAHLSKAHWLQSPHNYSPALAFDAYSYPVDVNSNSDARKLASAMKLAAMAVGVPMTAGETFGDNPHFELRGWKQLRNALSKTA